MPYVHQPGLELYRFACLHTLSPAIKSVPSYIALVLMSPDPWPNNLSPKPLCSNGLAHHKAMGVELSNNGKRVVVVMKC